MKDISKYKERFSKDWWIKMEPFFQTKECDEIYSFLKKRSLEGNVISPHSSELYKSFIDCPYNDLKVVIISKTDKRKDFLSEQGVLFLTLPMTWDKKLQHVNIWIPFFNYLFEKVFIYNPGLIVVWDNIKIIDYKGDFHIIEKKLDEAKQEINTLLLNNNNFCINWERKPLCPSDLDEKTLLNIECPF